MSALCALSLSLKSKSAPAANNVYQTWVSGVLNSKVPAIHSRVRGWFDFQVRRDDAGTQLLARPAIGLTLARRLNLFAGYTSLASWNDGAPDRYEHRFFTALWYKQPIIPEQLTLISRTMVETRSVQGASDTNARFRQLLRLTWVFQSPFSLFVFEEPFFHSNDTDWGGKAGFDQNRAGIGLGFKTVAGSRLEAAYMNMWVAKQGAPNSIRHTLFLTHFTVF